MEVTLRQLTKEQKRFIIDNFFRSSQYPDYWDVGMKLLETGQCIVAGNMYSVPSNHIIAPFVHFDFAPDTIGCLLYDFNLEKFLNSKVFKEKIKEELKDLDLRKKRLEDQLSELCKDQVYLMNLIG